MAQNYVRFIDVELNETDKALFSVQIKHYAIKNAYMVKIDRRTVNILLFETLKDLRISHTIVHVDGEIFKYLKNLIILTFELYNTREFYHSSTNKWMKDILVSAPMHNTTGQKGARTLNMLDISFAYDYPEEDFCLFKYFPYYRLIFTYIRFNETESVVKRNCTYFLLINMNTYINASYRLFERERVLDYNLANESLIKQCNIDDRVQSCFDVTKQSEPIKKESDFNYYDLRLSILWAEFLGSVVILPLSSILGLVLNMLSVIAILRTKKNQVKLKPAEKRIIE